jgi:hypothetical protein
LLLCKNKILQQVAADYLFLELELEVSLDHDIYCGRISFVDPLVGLSLPLLMHQGLSAKDHVSHAGLIGSHGRKQSLFRLKCKNG